MQEGPPQQPTDPSNAVAAGNPDTEAQAASTNGVEALTPGDPTPEALPEAPTAIPLPEASTATPLMSPDQTSESFTPPSTDPGSSGSSSIPPPPPPPDPPQTPEPGEAPEPPAPLIAYTGPTSPPPAGSQPNQTPSSNQNQSPEAEDPNAPEIQYDGKAKPSPEEFLGHRRYLYSEATKKYAAELEKRGRYHMGGRRERRQALEDAREGVKQAFDDVMEANYIELRATDDIRKIGITENSDAIAEARKRRSEWERKVPANDQESRDKVLALKELNLEIKERELRERDWQKESFDAPKSLNEYLAREVIGLRHNVESEIRKIRHDRHPRLAAMGDWLRNHPRTRLVAGGVLAGMGFVGTFTGIVPITIASGAALAALRGFGTYEFVRAAGELRGNAVLNRALSPREQITLDNYFRASEEQADWVRRGRGAGVILGALAAIGPAVGEIISNHASTISVAHHTTGHQHIPHPGRHEFPRVDLKPVDGSEYPWDYAFNNLHQNISAPSILSKLVNNHHGIVFNGNGLSGGQGQILSIKVPMGGGRYMLYHDPAHINAAIQYILGNNAS